MPNPIHLVGPISDDNIEWVKALMGLRHLDVPRREFLKSVETLDVSACPGSGKTTLVVAKLAILARKWSSSTQGICVLSHTNVAREEIQHRLAGAGIGHRLLGYPHYIDTIHGFVNRFLAIPWLLSQGHEVTAIDNEITTVVRRRNLGPAYYRTVKPFLDKTHYSLDSVRLAAADLENVVLNSGFRAGPQTQSYKCVAEAVRATAKQGYFCHDEMFLFGEALLARHPEVATILAQRFPFVMIDEMQDTSARQSRMLSTIFDRQSTVCLQRVGDANQAIFDDDEPPGESVFPDGSRSIITLASSFRFDSSIAALASGLALRAVEPDGLVGVRSNESSPQHTIFVFPDNDVSGVLPAYAQHIYDTFDEAALEAGSAVTAVGEVHQAKPDIRPGNTKYPGSVSHYWDAYQASMGRKTPYPASLIEGMRRTRSMVLDGEPIFSAVDVYAAGFIRAINLTTEAMTRPGTRPHRTVERLLADHPRAKQLYRGVLVRLILDGHGLDEHAWQQYHADFLAAVDAIAGRSATTETRSFLAWRPVNESEVKDRESAVPFNTFRLDISGRRIDIRLSSIHAVKGQTHLATLILETYNYSRTLKSLLPWLLGKKTGGGKATSNLQRRRLRMTYVAMTRPSALLCLALPDSSLGENDQQRRATKEELARRGWAIVEL